MLLTYLLKKRKRHYVGNNMFFIKLTDTYNNTIRFGVHNIAAYFPSKVMDSPRMVTLVSTINSGCYYVKETPELIDSILREAFITIKELPNEETTKPQEEQQQADCGTSNQGSTGTETEGS